MFLNNSAVIVSDAFKDANGITMESRAKLAKLEQEELALKKEVEDTQQCMDLLGEQRDQERNDANLLELFKVEMFGRAERLIAIRAASVVDVEKEKATERAILRLNADMAEVTARLSAMRRDRAMELQQLEEILSRKIERLAAKKKERIGASRSIDEQPSVLARRYSRSCPICQADNPSRRATLIQCGHLLCAPCTEEMAGEDRELHCPFCRTKTGYVRIYEEWEEGQEKRGEKRKHDGELGEGQGTAKRS